MTKTTKLLTLLLMLLIPLGTMAEDEFYAVIYDGQQTSLTFYYDGKRKSRLDNSHPASYDNRFDWAKTKDVVEKVIFDKSVTNYYPTNCIGWFEDFVKLSEIEGLHYLRTALVTQTQSMFAGCKSLEELDLSNFSLGNVTMAYSMFEDCTNLKTVNLDFVVPTSNLQYCDCMFRGCESLTTIVGFEQLHTEKVETMIDMFRNCSSLKSLGNLSNLRFTNCTNADGLFWGCSSLQSLDGLNLSGANKLTNIGCMFCECRSLKKLDLSAIVPTYVTNMASLFEGCKQMEELNIDFRGSTFELTSTREMFKDCLKLSKLTGLDKIYTDNVKNMDYMFANCRSLTEIDIAHFRTDSLRSARDMFDSCVNVKTIDMRLFKLQSGVKVDVAHIFWECNNLSTIYCNDNWMNHNYAGVFYHCNKLKSKVDYQCNLGVNDMTVSNQKPYPDMPGKPGGFTATNGLFYDGYLITADNAQSLATSGTISYDPKTETLTMDNAKIKNGTIGFWSPTDQSLWINLKGNNTISTKGTAIYTYDVFPTALTDGASLDITSEKEYGICMKGGGAFSGDESLTSKLCTVNIYGYKGAVNGEEAYNSWVGKDLSPKLIPNNMILNLSAGSSQPVVSGLSEIVERDVAYNYDNYYYNDEKRAVYDCGVRPNGDGEGVVVTHPFKIVPKDKLVQYNVNLGGNWINNYNADDFNPMSLTSGKVTYAYNSLKLNDAKFNTAYVPYDELYALYVEENGFLLNLEGNNSIAGTDKDYSYGLAFYENEEVDGARQWYINGLDNYASLTLVGELYCQSLGDENQAQLSIIDSKINVTDKAYFWQEDDVDLLIKNGELDLKCEAWPDQSIMEYFNSVTLQDCNFADGCYWDSQKGVLRDSSGQPATGRVRILRGSSTWKKGDVNHNGVVNTADVVAIYSFIEKGEASGISREAANVNGDTTVNTADVVATYDIIIKGSD